MKDIKKFGEGAVVMFYRSEHDLVGLEYYLETRQTKWGDERFCVITPKSLVELEKEVRTWGDWGNYGGNLWDHWIMEDRDEIALMEDDFADSDWSPFNEEVE
tara:strand:- start:36 stop:341 length:306 start_codon:yes stop_codon:yes gene_type:complete